MSEGEINTSPVDKEPRQFGIKKTMHFEDKVGETMTVDYYNFPSDVQDNRTNQDLAKALPRLMQMARKAFPHYDEQGYAALEQKFTKAKALDIISKQDGTVIGFHIFKVAEINGYETPLKTMYVDHAATDPDFEGRGITTGARKVIYDEEQPDIFCGSSANPAVYASNRKIAEEKGWNFYPTDQETPEPISRLASMITKQMGITNATLDDRLVRTYTGPVSRGTGEHPLQSMLNLGPTQHVFYMGIKPSVDSSISPLVGE